MFRPQAPADSAHALMPKPSCFEPEGEGTWSLIAPTCRACSHLRTEGRAYFDFAAAVPTVGFVYTAADLNPSNAAALEGYAEDRFIKRAPRIDTADRG